MDRVGCCRFFFSRMNSVFIFNILQFAGRCIPICDRCDAPTCTPLATGLYITEDTGLHSHL
jgi:hypothetical protein